MEFNYQQICSDLLRGIPTRTKDVISRRFGLKKKTRETLQSIGDQYSITRERVRQIETDGFSKLKPALKDYQEVFDYFQSHLKEWGDLRREDRLLSELGSQNFENQVFFLLAVEDRFTRHSETEDLHTFWSIEENALDLARRTINSLVNKFEKIKTPLSDQEIFEIYKKEKSSSGGKPFNERVLLSCLEVSKVIWQGPGGVWGLFDWPEINPRGIKDKAYLVFKKQQKPLHFREVANLIDQLNEGRGISALPQTVHNELIRDPRFVLVGRGIYALREWGYEQGVVKDIVLKILKENKKPLSRQEIVKQVLSQRLVKESTVLANLQDKKCFLRDLQGRYTVKKS